MELVRPMSIFVLETVGITSKMPYCDFNGKQTKESTKVSPTSLFMGSNQLAQLYFLLVMGCHFRCLTNSKHTSSAGNTKHEKKKKRIKFSLKILSLASDHNGNVYRKRLSPSKLFILPSGITPQIIHYCSTTFFPFITCRLYKAKHKIFLPQIKLTWRI